MVFFRWCSGICCFNSVDSDLVLPFVSHWQYPTLGRQACETRSVLHRSRTADIWDGSLLLYLLFDWPNSIGEVCSRFFGWEKA